MSLAELALISNISTHCKLQFNRVSLISRQKPHNQRQLQPHLYYQCSSEAPVNLKSAPLSWLHANHRAKALLPLPVRWPLATPVNPDQYHSHHYLSQQTVPAIHHQLARSVVTTMDSGHNNLRLNSGVNIIYEENSHVSVHRNPLPGTLLKDCLVSS